MKKLLFAAFALSILFAAASCKPNDKILVRFQNSLDSDIEAARMEFDETNVTDIGLIPAGEKTDYMVFDYFEVGDELPMGSLIGKKNGEEISAWSGQWCGTGVTYKQLEPGKYTLEITKVGDDTFWAYKIKFMD